MVDMDIMKKRIGRFRENLETKLNICGGRGKYCQVQFLPFSPLFLVINIYTVAQRLMWQQRPREKEEHLKFNSSYYATANTYD